MIAEFADGWATFWRVLGESSLPRLIGFLVAFSVLRIAACVVGEVVKVVVIFLVTLYAQIRINLRKAGRK